MHALASKNCRPLPKGNPALAAADVTAMLREFEGWNLDSGAITKTFFFPDYQQTLAFVNAVAWIATRQDHHPDLLVQFDRCRVSYATHSVGGISENDFICAARIEELFA